MGTRSLFHFEAVLIITSNSVQTTVSDFHDPSFTPFMMFTFPQNRRRKAPKSNVKRESTESLMALVGTWIEVKVKKNEYTYVLYQRTSFGNKGFNMDNAL